jgi:hypothetical protein
MLNALDGLPLSENVGTFSRCSLDPVLGRFTLDLGVANISDITY